MAEVRRKQRKTSLDVVTVSIGVEHGAHRERVSEVVEVAAGKPPSAVSDPQNAQASGRSSEHCSRSAGCQR